MDEVDDLPNIDLNPSGSDTIPSGDDEGSSMNGGGEPISGDHDQPPQDEDMPNVASSIGGHVSTDLGNSQSEESEDSDDDNDYDDESTLPSWYQAPRLPRSLEDKLNSYDQIIEDSDEEGVAEFTGPRSGKFLHLWHLVHEKSYSRKKNITEWQEKERKLKKEIKELKAKIVKLTPKLRQRTQKSWHAHFDSEVMISWSKLYAIACMEGNCSPKEAKLHPDLYLRKPTDDELRDGLLQTSDRPRSQHQEMSRSLDIPANIQFQILRHFFNFKGSVVHAISRLDLYHPVEQAPRDRYGRPSYLHRLHVGRDPISITFSPEPNVFLAPLLDRFARGINANVQRLQHVEMLWVGSQYLTHPPSSRGKYTSRRTFPLVMLPEALRLKTLSVYVQESSPSVMRRQHEPRGIIHHMKVKTQLQANYRLNRSLRTLQGMDYIYSLRGLSRVEFWDFDRWLDGHERKRPVRDFSFILDVNNSARRPKEAHDHSRSQLKNLYPVITSFRPSDQDWAILLEGLGWIDEGEECEESEESEENEESEESEDDRLPSPPPPPNDESGPPELPGPSNPSTITLDSDSNDDSNSDDDSISGSSSSSGPSSRSSSAPSGGDLPVDDSRQSRASSQASIVPMVEMLNLQDSEPHGEYESDDDSTVVPDNRSVTDQEVVDLTNEENGGEGNNSESQLNSAEFSSNNRPDSPLFVDDLDYIASYPSSPSGRIQDGQIPGRTDLTGLPDQRRDLATNQVYSLGSLGSEIEAIDLTGPDDLVDSFLPSDILNSPPSSRKRSFIKVEEDEEDEEDDEDDDDDDTSTDTPNSSKRVRTSSPESWEHANTESGSLF